MALASFFVSQAGAQAPAPAAAAEAAAGSEEIVVIGRGQVRQAQTLQAEALQAMPAGTSPIRALQRLPGVAVSGADTFGAYEWAARINIRGFNQNQLGFTLDGVPLGDMSYANHNGLHISRALISENLGSATLTQGSGAIDVASSSNLGGAVQFKSIAPQEDLGGEAAATFGSDDTRRYFARFEIGAIEGIGTRAWLSYMSSDMDKYKGEGPQKQTQWAIKAVQPIGKAELTGYYNDSKRRETDYQDLALDWIKRLGYDWDNFGTSRYALAVRVADIANNRGDTGAAVTNAAAGTVYPAPIQTADDSYFDASGLRDDQLGYIKLDLPVTEQFDVSLQAYNHQNKGQGLWGTPYVGSPNATVAGATTNNSPISIRTTEYDIDRQGFLGSATLRLGQHTINGGFWTEDNDFTQARRFYGLDRDASRRSFTSFQSNPFFTQWAYAFNTKITQYYLQDTWQVTEALKVNAGFKSLKVENEVR
ncbi:MAG: TonB-dependent receptor, partial [Alphaproteobacteria bacterium]|nr:TonB-dependent receptor [Alphaproteobacteria bacterium]